MGWVTCAQTVDGRQNQAEVDPRSTYIPNSFCHLYFKCLLSFWKDVMLQTWPSWENSCHALFDGLYRCLVSGTDLGGVLSSQWPVSTHHQIDGKCKLCWDAAGSFNKYSTGFYKRVYSISCESTNTETVSHITELLRSDFWLYETLLLWVFF